MIRIEYPAPPGLHECREAILFYLTYCGLAHLAADPLADGVTKITVFLVLDRWHMLIRSATYTGMRVFDHTKELEEVMDAAKIVSDEIPGSEIIVANPEFRPANS